MYGYHGVDHGAIYFLLAQGARLADALAFAATAQGAPRDEQEPESDRTRDTARPGAPCTR